MIDRIKQVMDYSGLTPAQFALELGINRSGLTHLFSGRNQPSLDLIKKILVAFPQIKTEWLMMGMGSMLKDQSNPIIIEKSVLETNEPDLFSQVNVTENKIQTTRVIIPEIPVEKTVVNVDLPKEVPNVEQEIKSREIKNQAVDTATDKIFNSREGKKVKKMVFLYEDNTFEIFYPSN
jgi:transcriptional regulator with XRE-family HTH domain